MFQNEKKSIKYPAGMLDDGFNNAGGSYGGAVRSGGDRGRHR